MSLSNKFAQCSNTSCRFVFPFTSNNDYEEASLLCPLCRSRLRTDHIIQCRVCKTIIGFFEIEDGEEPLVFYSKKCHNCYGSVEDEVRIQPFMYPELFM